VILYALAAAGGSAAYAPFLTIILPSRVSDIPGVDAVQVLSYCAFVGAIAASLSNIAFGWLSDRTQNRTGWLWAGIALSSALLVSARFVSNVPQLLAFIFVWQVSLNMMLGPLSAWAGDCVPDHQKGTLGGLLAVAPGGGALVGAVVTIPHLADGDERLVLIALLVVALMLPVLVWGKPRSIQHLTSLPPEASTPDSDHLDGHHKGVSSTVLRMWSARLLVQIAEASLFAFLLVWLRGLHAGVSDNSVATLFAAVLLGSVPLALLAGRWSDRTRRPIFPLVAAAGCAAGGLLAMVGAETPRVAMASYAVFGVSAAVFLALHTSQTLRVLPRPQHRGRDLGYFNLTNTIPSLIMPGLTLALIPMFGFEALFAALTLLVASAAFLLAPLRVR